MNQETYQDRPTMAKWNELVAAVGTMPKIATGTYTGDGATERFIDLGATPKALYVTLSDDRGSVYDSYGIQCRSGLAFPELPVWNANQTNSRPPTAALEIIEGGFTVREIDYDNMTPKNRHHMNLANHLYYYIALL